jgi:KDO2-lipid IV(A) lauroyltransferase
MVLRRSSKHSDWLQKLKWHSEAFLSRLLVTALKGRTHTTMRQGVRIARTLAEPVLTKRIKTAAANLELVYGDQLTPRQRKRLAAQSLDSFFLSCLESIIQPIEAELIHVEGEGLDELFRCRKEGQGFIVGSLHLGCWDIALRWLSQHLDNLSVIYRPARNPYTDSILNVARSSNSQCHWISQRNAKAMLLKLRQGCGLVMMTDLYKGHQAVSVDFLGINTNVAPGPLVLSQKAGCPFFPVAHVREDDGRFRLICGKPLHPSTAATDLHERAGALGRWQEPWINAYAEQYYWINRRWRPGDGTGQRLRPSGLLAERALAKVNG